MRLHRLSFQLPLLAALVFLAYGPTLTHQFVWDDHEQVEENQHLRSWSSLPEIWTKDILALAKSDGPDRSNYYRPLFFTTYLLLYQLFGASAVAWHAAALVVHWLAVVAALFFLRRLGLSPPAAFAGALLFAVHPVHGESVSWVAAAFNDPPAAALMLLALIAHTRWIEDGRRRWLAWGALAYAGALLFKESALAMVFLLPLVEHFLAPERGLRPRLLGWLPTLGTTAGYFALRKALLGSFLGVYPGSGWGEILPTLPRLGLEYLRFLLWPWGYAPSYPLRFVAGWSAPAAWGSLAALLAAGALLVWLYRRWPRAGRWLGFAALWFLFCALPALNVRSFRPTYLVHQRYLYLAVLGLCGLLAWVLWEKVRAPKVRATLLAVLLAVWTASLWWHNRFWSTDTALCERITQVDPGNPAAFDWLGARALEEKRLDDAERLFRASIDADPTSPHGAHNLALTLHTGRGRPAEALPWYEQALARYAETPRYPAERARCRVSYGVALASLGRPQDALVQFRESAFNPPYLPEAARNMAVILAQAGRFAEAQTVLEAAVKRHPEDAHLRRMLADLARMPAPAPKP